MHKAIRSTSGKPVTAENIDKRDAAAQAATRKPTGDMRKLDRDYEPNRKAQAEREQVQDSAAVRNSMATDKLAGSASDKS